MDLRKGSGQRHVGSSSTFYTFDERGNVAQRLDSSCNVLTTVTSDDYGVSNATSSSGDPYGYFGAQFGYYADSETGLYLLGHRYYDSNVARFLNQDPIGQGGGNVYSFCLNNGINGADPSGLDGMWYDRWADAVNGAVSYVKDQVTTAYGGSVLGDGFVAACNTLVDVGGGILRMPHMIGHLGEGMGTYAGDPSEKNLAGYYGDLSNVLSLGLIGVDCLGDLPGEAAEAPASGEPDLPSGMLQRKGRGLDS